MISINICHSVFIIKMKVFGEGFDTNVVFSPLSPFTLYSPFSVYPFLSFQPHFHSFPSSFSFPFLFHVSRSLSPLSSSSLSFPFSVLAVTGKPFFVVSSFSHRWLFGWEGCRFYGWAGFFFGCGSLITMTVVSLDRYLKICHLRYGTSGSPLTGSPKHLNSMVRYSIQYMLRTFILGVNSKST